MKTFKPLCLFLVTISLASLGACPSGNISNGEQLAHTAPTVVSARTNPGTFELNQNLDPVSRTQIVADVKDYSNKVTDVRIRFVHIPMEIPMHQASASTWVADLQPQQLKQLAVNGHTMKYEANVIARDNQGQTGMSAKPLEIAVKAPDINATG